MKTLERLRTNLRSMFALAALFTHLDKVAAGGCMCDGSPKWKVQTASM